MRMRHVVPAPRYNIFPHYLINGTISEEKKKKQTLLNIQYVFRVSLQMLSEISFIIEELREICSNMYIGLHVKYPLNFSAYNETWIFENKFSKNTQTIHFMKIRQWETSCSMRAAMTKLIVAFRNFANAPK
jgi:hypothetical protein